MFVSVNGARLFFDVLNPRLEIVADRLEVKPVLVCLHGGPGGDHQSLRPAFDRLAGVAQIVYLDQRGGGRSDHGEPASWTLDQWADDVAGFCDALGIDKPIVLGVSGGALVAQAYLARHPDHASAVVLVNGCSRLDREALVAGFSALGGPEAGAAARAMYTRGAPADVPGFFQHCLPWYSRRPTPAPTDNSRATFNFAVSQHFFGPDGEAFRFDHRECLRAVACPVLVLVGAHDPVTRAEWGREVAAALPPDRVTFTQFEDSSHLITADEPELFFATVEAFVKRL